MKSMHKPMLILAAIMALGFAIVFGGISLWFNSSPGLNWLLSRINTAIPGTVSIERCRLSLIRPRLELAGVTAFDPHGTPVAGWDRISVALRWWPLLRQEIHLQEVLLRGPWADLALDAGTGLNLIRVFTEPGSNAVPPADGGGLQFNIVCRSFRLTDGRVSFRPADDPTQVQADGINLSAAGDLMARQARLDLDVSRVRYRTATIHPPPAQITLKARLDGEQLHLPTLTITAGGTTAHLEGSVEAPATAPVVNISLAIRSQLSELKNIMAITGDYRGTVNVDLRLDGELSDPLARLDLTIDDGRVAGQPLDRLQLSAKLEGRQLTVSDSALKLTGGTVDLSGAADLRPAFPSGFLNPTADVNAITYRLNLVAAIAELEPWLKPWTPVSGKMDGHIDIAGKGVMPSAMSTRLTLGVSGRQLLAPGMDRPADVDVHLAAQMNRGRILIDRLAAATEGLELNGTARLDLNDRTLGADIGLAAPDLSRALAVAGITSASGACHATLTADGSLDHPQVAFNLSAGDLGLDTYTVGDLAITAGLDRDGLLEVSTLTVKNGESRIEGSGRLRFQFSEGQIDPHFDNTAAFEITSLSALDFMASPPVAGTLDGRLTANGPLSALKGTISLKGASLATQAVTIGDIDTRLRWDDGTVHLDRLDLTNRASSLAARGRIQLLSPGSITPVQNPPFVLNLATGHIDPGDFVDRVRGDFRLKAALAGRIEDPEGTIAIGGQRIEAAGQPLSALSFEGRLNQKRLWIDKLTAVVANEEEIAASGWIGLDQTLAIRAESDGITLSSIRQLKERVPANGKLRLTASARGSVHNPDIEADLTLFDIAVNDEALDDMHLTVDWHDMHVKADGDLNFLMHAACDLRKGDFLVNLVFDDTETATYFKAAGLPDLHGKLSGQASASGNIRDVKNAAAAVNIDALHLLSRDVSLVRTDRIHVQLEDGRLTVPAFELALLTTGSLHLKGDARLDGGLDMAVNGRLPLAAAGAFSPDLGDAAGILTLDGRISGTMDEPLIDARINLEAIAMVIPGIAQKLHDLNGRILLAADTIRIQRVNGFLDTGAFSVDGTVGHDHFTPTAIDLAVTAKALPLDIPDTLSVLLNSDIRISGRDGTAGARGEIVILEGLYYKDVKINLLKLATERQRSVKPASEPLTIPYFDTVNLDIDIGHRQAFEVQNNLADLDISPDLQIRGTLAQPIVNGRAQVKEGTVTFQRRIFNVTRGVIDFVNPYKTEAEIDIVSRAEIRAWTITLTIKGSPDNLDLELSSVPSETDSDILSLILFGKTGRELSGGGNGTRLSTGQIMTELIADTFGEDIKKNTGVDILEVEETTDATGGENGETVNGIKVTVGKHLSDRMTVKYAVESKDGELIQRAISEYKLLENILVSGFQDSNGIYGSELVFRIEFR